MFDFSQMEKCLLALFPETSQVCFALFVALNICIGLNYFWTRCATITKHVRLCTRIMFECNIMLVTVIYAGTEILPLFVPQALSKPLEQLMQCSWTGKTLLVNAILSLRFHTFQRCSLSMLAVTFVIAGTLVRQFRMHKNVSIQDDLMDWNVFECVKLPFCWLNSFLFRGSVRRSRRRYVASGQSSTSILSAPPNDNVAASIFEDNELLTNDEDEDSDDDEDAYFDVEGDMDRLLIDSMFTMPNLWLKTELISNEYIHRLPVWNHSVVEATDTNKHINIDQGESSSLLVTSAPSSSCTDSSDNESFSITKQKNLVKEQANHFHCQLTSQLSVEISSASQDELADQIESSCCQTRSSDGASVSSLNESVNNSSCKPSNAFVSSKQTAKIEVQLRFVNINKIV